MMDKHDSSTYICLRPYSLCRHSFLAMFSSCAAVYADNLQTVGFVEGHEHSNLEHGREIQLHDSHRGRADQLCRSVNKCWAHIMQ